MLASPQPFCSSHELVNLITQADALAQRALELAAGLAAAAAHDLLMMGDSPSSQQCSFSDTEDTACSSPRNGDDRPSPSWGN